MGEGSLLPARGVSSLFLGDVLSRYCSDFRGVYASDNIPLGTRLVGLARFSIVVNLSPADHPGSHYVVITADERRICYCDPLLLPASYIGADIRNFLATVATARRRRIFIKPATRVQHPESNYCGLFALAYVLHFDSGVQGKPARLDFEPVADDCADRERNVERCLTYILRMMEASH